MRKAILLTALSVLLTILALLLYRWVIGYVFGAELGWLRFFVR